MRKQAGFTVMELTVVFLILAFLLGGIALTFKTQNEAREVSEAQRALEQARDALLGFAVRNGRLPCPATATSDGRESFCTDDTPSACGAEIVVPPGAPPDHGRCTAPDGFLPAVTLEIGPVLGAAGIVPGALVDPWQQPVRYAVTQANAPAVAPDPFVRRPYTAPNGLRQIVLRQSPFSGDLQVCNAGTGLIVGGAPPGNVACGVGVTAFTTPAVIFATGKNALLGGAPDTDDQENGDNDLVFVAHEAAPGFDDLVLWISTNILFNRLIGAGAL